MQSSHSSPISRWLLSVGVVVVLCLAVGLMARIGFVMWLAERVQAADGAHYILLQGLRFDLVMLGLLLVLPLILTPLALAFKPFIAPWLRVVRWYLLLLVGAVVFLEVATPAFINEYDVRPNFLFVEYLRYPAEVLPMLWATQKLGFAVAAVLLVTILWPLNNFLNRQFAQIDSHFGRYSLPIALVGLLLCLGAARSTFDHRPVNPSTVAFSNDTLVNTLPLGSLYSVLYAIYELRHEDQGFSYGQLDIRACAPHAPVRFSSNAPGHESANSVHWQQATQTHARPKNLVIIVEESLGAEFVGRLGGLRVTPNLDRLGDQGVWFEQMYATGTRSARGLEAIVSGFPPTTSQSVLKLGRAQTDFFTLGSYLKEQGYNTSFIYGGEAQFDNMRRFFANNGFDHILDKHDFDDPVFLSSWGASDEDVFQYAHEYFSSFNREQPFVSVVFTTSNHSPWEFPDNRIELYDQPKATVNNAVKYADYALGRYFDMAMQSSYWQDTVFLVVADHNSRVRGAELVPIDTFHIPALILGGGIDSQIVTRRASQIDLFPTLMSYIGVSGRHPAVGTDLTRPDIADIPQQATMQYGGTQAYWVEDKVVILQKGAQALAFDYLEGTYIPTEPAPELIDAAICNAQWPMMTYRDRLYHLPENSSKAALLIR